MRETLCNPSRGAQVLKIANHFSDPTPEYLDRLVLVLRFIALTGIAFLVDPRSDEAPWYYLILIIEVAAAAVLSAFSKRLGITKINLTLAPLDLLLLSVTVRLGDGLASGAYIIFFPQIVTVALFSNWRVSMVNAVAAIVLYLAAVGEMGSDGDTWSVYGFRAFIILMTAAGVGLLREGIDAQVRNLRREKEQSRQRAEYLATLNEIGRVVTSTLDLGELYEVMYRQVRRVMEVDGFFVALYHADKQTVELPFIVDDGEHFPPTTFNLNDGPTSQCIKQGRPLIFNPNSPEDMPQAVTIGSEGKVVRSIIVVPMILERRVIGAISAQSYSPRAYADEQLNLLVTIASQAAVAVENARLYQRTREMSLTDALTGLGNQRYLWEQLDKELARSDRNGQPVTLVMMDSDSLKTINDLYGHPAGDLHIIQIANVLRETARQSDTIARYAGDEFMVILPETDREGGLAMAERIRAGVEAAALDVGGASVRATVSVGVACYPEDARDSGSLVIAADSALYRAKRNGKNRICSARISDSAWDVG